MHESIGYTFIFIDSDNAIKILEQRGAESS